MARYKNTSKIVNDVDYYEFLIKKRNIKKALHYQTPILHQPTIAQRTALKTTGHIWKYGDRFYNLASKYYGNTDYWWVIAWYNGKPTEAHCNPGDVLDIPINIENTLKMLGY